MKTKTRIKEVAEARGITTAYQLQKVADLFPSMAARLYRDDVDKIALTTIDALCDALECNPCDLLVRVDDSEPIEEIAPGVRKWKAEQQMLPGTKPTRGTKKGGKK